MLTIGTLLVRLSAAMLAGFAIVVAALAWRVSEGPLSIAFLAPYLGEALALGEGAPDAEIGDVLLTWPGWGQPVEVRALDVRLSRPGGGLLAAVPDLRFSFDSAALLRGRLRPVSIDLRGSRMVLRRDHEGRFDFGFDDAGGGSEDMLALLAHGLSRPGGGGISESLRRVRLRGAELLVEDAASGITWRAPSANLDLWRDPEGLRGMLGTTLDLAGRLAHVSATGVYHAARNDIEVRIGFGNVDVAALAGLHESLASLDGARFPAAGWAEFAVSGSGEISTVEFSLDAGAGEFTVPDLGAEPLPLQRASLRGRLEPADDLLRIENFAAVFDGFELTAAGELAFSPAGVGLRLEASMPSLATDLLHRYWPPAVAPNAREWIRANISDGGVEDVRLRTDLTAEALASGDLPEDALTLDFRFQGLAAQYFRPLPPITNGQGEGRLTPRNLDLRVAAARVGDIALGEGRVEITGLDVEDQDAVIHFVAKGPAASVLTLLDHPPLGFAGDLGVEPGAVSGATATRARFAFPLSKKLTLEEVEIAAAANLSDVAMPAIFDRFDLDRGEFGLRVDRQRMEIRGQAALNGVPVDVAWQEEFQPAPGLPGSRYSVSGETDEAGRRRLGFPTDPYILGPVAAEVQVEVTRGSEARIEAALDLAAAALRSEELLWGKPSGEPAELRLVASIPEAGPASIGRIQLTAGGLTASGSALIDAGELRRLSLERVLFGANDFGGELRRGPDGALDLELRGESFDLRPYLEQEAPESAAPAGEGPEPPLDLRLALDSVVVGDATPLRQVSGTASRRDGRWSHVGIDARPTADSTLQLRLGPEAGGRRVLLSSDDAGAVLAAFGLSENTLGGRLSVNAFFDDTREDAPLQGQAVMQDFTVVRAPLLARLLTVGSLTGIGEILRGEGIGFVRAEVPFMLAADQIRIDTARAWGAAIGFSVEGTMDRRGGNAALSGTIVPAYTINTALGYIPLLGPILVGRPGEGVIGFTYRVGGSLDDPQVTVNPLSALAPGILRRLFEPADPNYARDLIGDVPHIFDPPMP